MAESANGPAPEHVCQFTRERLHRLEATPSPSGDFLESRIVRARFCECGRYRLSDRRVDVGLIRSPRLPATPEGVVRACLSRSEEEVAVVRALLRLAQPAGRTDAAWVSAGDRAANSARDSARDSAGPTPPRRLHCSVNGLLRVAPPALAKLTALDALLSQLARDGLGDLVYRRPALTRPLELREVLVSPDIIEALAGALGVHRPGTVDQQTLTFIGDICRRLAALSDQPEALAWADLADRHRKAIGAGLRPDLTGGAEGAVVARCGTRKYRQLWLALVEALKISASGEDMPLRELSVRVTGDSKSLATLRGDLDRLGVNLEEWGIYEHQPILRAVGPVEYRVPGDRGAARFNAVADYACLTLKTVSSLEITRNEADAVLIVENLTPFEALARESHSRLSRVLLIYAGGFIGRAETTLLRKVLGARPVPGFIWTDLDLGGHRIFGAVERVFKQHGTSLTRIASAPEFIDGAVAGVPLAAGERAQLERLLATGEMPAEEAEWLGAILSRGTKVEQEAQLGKLSRLLEALLLQLGSPSS